MSQVDVLDRRRICPDVFVTILVAKTPGGELAVDVVDMVIKALLVPTVEGGSSVCAKDDKYVVLPAFDPSQVIPVIIASTIIPVGTPDRVTVDADPEPVSNPPSLIGTAQSKRSPV